MCRGRSGAASDGAEEEEEDREAPGLGRRGARPTPPRSLGRPPALPAGKGARALLSSHRSPRHQPTEMPGAGSLAPLLAKRS